MTNRYTVPADAVAIHVYRVRDYPDREISEATIYTGANFDDVADPVAIIAEHVAKLAKLKFLRDNDGDHIMLEISNYDGDPVATYPMTERGFKYLQRKLGFKPDYTETLGN